MRTNVFYRTYLNRRKVHDNKMYKAYKSALDKIMLRVRNELKIPSVDYMESILIANTSKVIVNLFQQAFRTAISDVQTLYGKTLPKLQKSIEIKKEVFLEDLLMLGLPSNKKILEIYAISKIKTIAKDLFTLLKKEFSESISLGESQEKLIVRIKGIQDQTTWRARRIAQTEVTRIYNGGSLLGYQKSGVAKKKQWVSNLMGNPRHPPESEFDHLGAHGEIVPVKEPFQMTGEAMMYPGDSDGSAGNVINCHCGIQPVIGKIERIRV